jgi:hypothetical protein
MEACLKYEERLLAVIVQREATLRGQWYEDVKRLRAHLKSQKASQGQQLRVLEEEADKSAAAVATPAAATPAAKVPKPKASVAAKKAAVPSAAGLRLAAQRFASRGGGRGGQPSGRGASKQGKRVTAAQTGAAPPPPGKRRRSEEAGGGPAEAPKDGDSPRAKDGHGASPGSPKAPFVEFVGAPVGKGAKIPTGLWPFPAALMTRSRTKAV